MLIMTIIQVILRFTKTVINVSQVLPGIMLLKYALPVKLINITVFRDFA